MRQASIFREPGRFGGWPANYGIWHWGDEIVGGARNRVERFIEAAIWQP